MNTKKSNTNETCESIKLGIDAHAKWYYVGRQVDGATPQPVQKMTFEGLLRFVAKQEIPFSTLRSLRTTAVLGTRLEGVQLFQAEPSKVRVNN
jgi:hypothetical protein